MRFLFLFLALFVCAPTVAAAQTVGTYTEDNGTAKNRIGVAISTTDNTVKVDTVNSGAQLQSCEYQSTPTTTAVGRVNEQCDVYGRVISGVTRVGNPNQASITFTTANTAQTVVTANTNRAYLFCQNPIAATTPVFVDFSTVSATGSSYELQPGGSITFQAPGVVPTAAVVAMSATAGARFFCKHI